MLPHELRDASNVEESDGGLGSWGKERRGFVGLKAGGTEGYREERSR